MSTKQELVGYLASLIAIDEYLDDRGIPTPNWLNKEETDLLAELEQAIVEEHKANEARKSEQKRERERRVQPEGNGNVAQGGSTDRPSGGGASAG